MQDAKHTPGPWVLKSWHEAQIVTRNGRDPIASVYADKNRKLIAAAPELLEALRLCIDAFAPGHGAASEDKRSAIDSAYAAIAKATAE